MDGACTHPRIDHRRCTACGLCVAVCVCGALVVQGDAIVLAHPERCDDCGLCEEICPEGAIDCEFAIVWDEGQEPTPPRDD